MSIKKAFIFRLFLNTVDKARRDPNLIKKIGIIALISGLFFTAVIGVLLYFTVGIAKDLMAKKPDMDLLAMERLIAEKSLILSKEQQQLVSPILETLAQNNLPADQYQALKEQLAKTIDPSQLA
ncbi:MAG: hypothetical protein FP813_01905, partial [Desulfurivibrio sp.]|nr:hypothetical protein [Desulfurivibrio sp.]MBU4153987.1 hypothetical protein [Pseudomonadota bacterium]